MRLTETLKSVIVEIASIENVIDCIKNRKKCIIYYDGDEPGGKGLREIEPVAFGISKAGNKVLRAWEVEGSSHRGYLGKRPMPGWRLFRLDKILSLKPTADFFDEIRPNFNRNGDKSMNSVIIVSKF
jgi:predicted DNA-binding transcriptional regulator YafY